MGRDAHLMRVMLGRGATEAPDWRALTDSGQYALVNDQQEGVPEYCHGSDPDKVVPYLSNTGCFDAKGRPLQLPQEKAAQKDANAALNAVTSLMQYNAALPMQPKDEEGSGPHLKPQSPYQLESLDLTVLYTSSKMINDTALYYVRSLRLRSLAFLNFSQASLFENIRQDLLSHGSVSSLFSGWSTAVCLRGLVEQAILYPAITGLHTILGMLLPSQPLIKSFCECTRSISEHIFDLCFLPDPELQGLYILPEPSWTSPFPLFNLLRRLPVDELASCIIFTVGPAYIVRRLCLGRIRPLLERYILNQCYAWYQERKPEVLQSRLLRVQSDFLERGIHKTSSWDLPLRYTFNHVCMMTRRIPGLVSALKQQLTPSSVIAHAWQPLPLEFVNSREKVTLVTQPMLNTHGWTEYFFRRELMSLLEDVVFLPVAGVVARFTAFSFLQSPLLRYLPNGNALKADLRPLFPSFRGSLTSAGLFATGRLVSKIATTFLMQAALWTVLVGFEGAISLYAARRRARREDVGLRDIELPTKSGSGCTAWCSRWRNTPLADILSERQLVDPRVQRQF